MQSHASNLVPGHYESNSELWNGTSCKISPGNIRIQQLSLGVQLEMEVTQAAVDVLSERESGSSVFMHLTTLAIAIVSLHYFLA